VVHAHLRQPPLQSERHTLKLPQKAHPVADTARPLLAVRMCVDIPVACTPPSAAVAVGTVTCALTYLMLPRSELDLNNNAITSLAGVTFNFTDCE